MESFENVLPQIGNGDSLVRAAGLKRVWFPVGLAAINLVMNAVVFAWEMLDWDPFPLLLMLLGTNLLMILSVPLLLIWFFLLGGVSGRMKLAGVGLLAALAGVSVACVRKVDFGDRMRPSLVYRWDRDPVAVLQAHLAEVAAKPRPKVATIDVTVDPARDYPRYRGLNCDGASTGPQLAGDWSVAAPKEIWRQPCGGGFAGIAVAGSLVVTLEQRDADEVIVGYDRATGRELWKYSYPARFTDPTGDGPRSTPTIDGGQVFTMGALGQLVCVDAATGKEIWSHNVVQENDARPELWGMSGSPAVHGDLVIVSVGFDSAKPDVNSSLVAYDRHGGKKAWGSGRHPAGYCSPQIVELRGQPTVVMFDGDGLAGFDPVQGKELWRYEWKTFSNQNISQPLVVGPNRLYVSTEVANGGVVLEISREGEAWSVKEVWKNRLLCARYSNPLVIGDRIYGLSSGIMVCLDANNGKKLWKQGRFGSGQLVRSGNVIFGLTENGEVVCVQANDSGYTEAGRLQVLTGKTWNTQALAGRQLFVRNESEIVCLELAEAVSGQIALGAATNQAHAGEAQP